MSGSGMSLLIVGVGVALLGGLIALRMSIVSLNRDLRVLLARQDEIRERLDALENKR